MLHFVRPHFAAHAVQTLHQNELGDAEAKSIWFIPSMFGSLKDVLRCRHFANDKEMKDCHNFYKVILKPYKSLWTTRLSVLKKGEGTIWEDNAFV